MRDHVDIVGNDRLTAMCRYREQVDQRVAGRIQCAEFARLQAIADPRFENDSTAADRRYIVADGAARAVERRPETILGCFDLHEIIEAEAKLREFDSGDPGQWIARLDLACLAADHERADQGRHTPCT